MNNYKRSLKIYHNQAEKDIFAQVPDLSDRIISTTIREIKAAYQEALINDLLLESQEAY